MMNFAWTVGVLPGGPGDAAEIGALLGIGFDRSAHPMLLLDEDSEVICANAAAGGLFDTDAGALLGRRHVQFAPLPTDRIGGRETASYRTAAAGQVRRETALVTDSGRSVLAELRVDVLTTDGGRSLSLIQLCDVTDDRRRQQELAGHELRHRHLAEGREARQVLERLQQQPSRTATAPGRPAAPRPDRSAARRESDPRGVEEEPAVAIRLQELTDQQRELIEQLSSTETRERALLAEAVHDDPMQLIVAAILRIDNVRLGLPDGQGAELDEIATLLETSVERLRKIIVAISPPDLTGGLGLALRNLADGIFIGTDCVVTVLGSDHVRLGPQTKATAYRIMREALVNARKHAHASNVTLQLTERDGEVILSLTDDGVGAASLKPQPGHLGMATMRARAKTENARLDLDSTEGRGTTVVLTLPIAGGGS